MSMLDALSIKIQSFLSKLTKIQSLKSEDTVCSYAF
jgi:hypothetical protein